MAMAMRKNKTMQKMMMILKLQENVYNNFCQLNAEKLKNYFFMSYVKNSLSIDIRHLVILPGNYEKNGGKRLIVYFCLQVSFSILNAIITFRLI